MNANGFVAAQSVLRHALMKIGGEVSRSPVAAKVVQTKALPADLMNRDVDVKDLLQHVAI